MLGQLLDGGQHARLALVLLVGQGGLGPIRGQLGDHVQRDRLDAPAAREAAALREDDALEPAGEGLGLAQLVEVAPGRQERLLGRVLGQVKVAQHGIGIGVGEILEAAHDLAERLALLGAGGARRRRPGYQRSDLFHRSSLHPGLTWLYRQEPRSGYKDTVSDRAMSTLAQSTKHSIVLYLCSRNSIDYGT